MPTPNGVDTVPVTPTPSYAPIPTQSTNPGGEGYVQPTIPAPTVVTSQTAEDMINKANGNVANFNATAPTPPVSGNTNETPSTNGTPSGITPDAEEPGYGVYVDPKTGQSSYFAQTGTDQNGNPTYASEPTDANTVLSSGLSSVQIPQPPTGGFISPYAPGASIDSDGNIYGTNVPAATALGSSGDVATLNAQIAQGNTQIMQAGQNAMTYLQQWQSGQIPLNPAQQSLVTNMTNQMNDLIELQQGANASNIGAATEANARGQRYDPVNAMGMINQAITKANLDLGALQSAQAIAIANVQIQFQSQNYEEMLSANDDYQKAVEATQSTLETLATNIQSSIESARAFNEKAQQDIFANQMSSATLTLQQKNDLYQNYISGQNLTIAQKQLAIDQYNAATQREIAANGRYEVTSVLGMPMVFDKQAGEVVGSALGGAVNGTYTSSNGQVSPGNTGIPILDQNTKTSSTGVPYVDGTNLSGDTATQAQYMAASYGIPYMSSDKAQALNKINEAASNMEDMSTYIKQLNPANGIVRPFVAASQWLQGATQIGPQAAALSSYNGFVNAAVSAIQAIAAGGTGLRVTQTEISNMMNTVPSPSDTQDVAQSKLALFKALLDNNERSIVGAKVYDQYNPNQATQDLANIYQNSGSNPVPGSTQTYQATIDSLRSQGYSPSQILQVVLP